MSHDYDDEYDYEPRFFPEVSNLIAVLAVLVFIGIVFSVWMLVKNRNVEEPQPAEADTVAQIEQKATVQEEARLERLRLEREQIREAELKAEARIKAEAAAERERAIGQRNSLLASIDEFLERRRNFEQRLDDLLTNDEGRQISSSDKFMREYTELRELGIRPERRDIITLKEAVPREHKYNQEELPLYAPSTVDLDRIHELSSSLDTLRGMLVQDEITLDELIQAAKDNEPASPLKEAMAEWKIRESHRLDALKDSIAAENQIFQPGAKFGGFWTGKRNRRSFFRILIEERQANTFRGVIDMGRLDSRNAQRRWIDGVLKENKVILRSYAFERIRDDLKYGQAGARLKGFITGKVVTGTVETFEPATGVQHRNGERHFYMQLIQREDPFDLVNNPADLLAPGAIWEGYATQIRPKRGEQFFVQLNIRMRTSSTFAGVMQPGDRPIIDGVLKDDGQIWWKIKEKPGQTTEFRLKVADDAMKGVAATVASGLRVLHEVDLEFRKIDLGFWKF